MIARLLTAMLGKPEEINGAGRCPTYFYRWHVFSCRFFKVYIHRFVGEDWSLDLHDHPKRFFTVGLWGSYVEETPARGASFKGPTVKRRYRAPWLRSFPAEHRHRVEVDPGGECWTLVAVGRGSRAWGYIHPYHGWIHWRDYVLGSFGWLATDRAVCRSVEVVEEVGAYDPREVEVE